MHSIQEYIIQALASLDISFDGAIDLEHPADTTHGDYSTNIAMKLFSTVGKEKGFKSPRDLATSIADAIKSSQINHQSSQALRSSANQSVGGVIEKIEVAGPGFINFYLSQEWLVAEMQKAQDESYGNNQDLAGKKIVVEYTDPNPFKEFHIGHLYSNIVGESIAKLVQANGATVWRADYFGDVGMHVACSIWGLLQNFKDEHIDITDLEKYSLTKKVQYFGKSYARGAEAYKNNEVAIVEIKALNFLIFKAAQEIVLGEFNEKPQINYDQFITESSYDYETIKHIYTLGRKWSLDYFEEIYKRLGTQFNGYYPESRTGEFGYGMVMDGLEKGIFEKGDKGAIIFPGEKHGLHNRVFINALGLPTYETKDFGNSVAKYKDFQYDSSIIVTGNEIDDYFKVVLQALRIAKPELGNITTHISHGMVRLPEGKMSSRTGKILRGEWLIDEAKTHAKTILKDSKTGDINTEELADVIGQAAIKYALLKQSIGSNVEFNFDDSVSFEGNSGPYIQYTYARTQSILRKAPLLSIIDHRLSLINPEELALLRIIYQFPEVVSKAAKEYAPHIIATYLFELAQNFNTFYAKHSVLGDDVEKVSKEFRLNITTAIGNILKQGLGLLGIKAPEKM